MTEYMNKKIQELDVEQHELLIQKPKTAHDRRSYRKVHWTRQNVINIDDRIKQIETKIKNPEKTYDSGEIFESAKFTN